jgi:hypothetical protein
MRDVEKIIKAIKENSPDVKLRQLKVSHAAADDNGLWFFEQPKQRVRSPNRVIDGDVPFFNRNTREQHKVCGALHRRGGRNACAITSFPSLSGIGEVVGANSYRASSTCFSTDPRTLVSGLASLAQNGMLRWV